MTTRFMNGCICEFIPYRFDGKTIAGYGLYIDHVDCGFYSDAHLVWLAAEMISRRKWIEC